MVETRFVSTIKRYLFVPRLIFPNGIADVVDFEEGVHYYDSYCIQEADDEEVQNRNQRWPYSNYSCHWCYSPAYTTKMTRILGKKLHAWQEDQWREIDVCGVCFLRTTTAQGNLAVQLAYKE